MSSASLILLALLGAGPAGPDSALRAVPREDTSFVHLVAQWRSSARRQEEREVVRSRRREEDTLLVGGLRLLALPEAQGAARVAAQAAAARLTRLYGPLDQRTLLAPIRVVREGAGTWQLTLFPAAGGAVSRGGIHDNAAFEDGVAGFAEQALWLRVDSTLRAWLPSTPPERAEAARMIRLSYYGFALAGSTVAQGCFRGDLGACEEALGLVPTRDPASRWYEANGRRALVAAARWDWGPIQMDWFACTQDNDDAACLQILRRASTLEGRSPAEARVWGNDVFPLPWPLGDEARMRYLEVVLQTGGPGAWERLIAHPERPLFERFAVASGVPGDSTLTLWRDLLLRGRPEPQSVPSLAVVAAVGWAACWFGVSCWGRR